MIKFSTKTNYRIVRVVQRSVIFMLKALGKDVTKVKASRHGIKWHLNLNEVIDFMIYFTGGFDQSSIRAFTKRLQPHDVVIDIGGNIGAFCLPVGKSLSDKGRVVTIEPSAFALEKMKQNIQFNKGLEKKIDVVHAFVSEDDDVQTPKEVYASWNTATHERHEHHQGILTPTEGAITITVDRLVDQMKLERLDWLKIDVDGYEHDVFRGAKETIKSHRPGIFLELCEYSLLEHGSSVEELLKEMSELKYTFKGMSGESFGQDAEKIKKRIPDMGTINIFALPIEKAE